MKEEKKHSIESLENINDKIKDAINSMIILTVSLQEIGFDKTAKETKEVIGDLATAQYLLLETKNLR
jgi:FtsZ-binding cell division protein ZapB